MASQTDLPEEHAPSPPGIPEVMGAIEAVQLDIELIRKICSRLTTTELWVNHVEDSVAEHTVVIRTLI